MSNAIVIQQSSNMRAMVGSIALHALLAVSFLTGALPVEMLPQQVIKVSLIAPPAARPEEKKPTPVIVPVPKQEIKPRTVQKPPVVTKEAARAMYPVEEAAVPPQVQELAALSPAAGVTASAEAAQLVMTTPLFDAAYLRNPVPDYPAQAKRRGMEGSVMLDVVVREDGTARSVVIAESSGFSMLDGSAKEAVSRWKFIPAKRGDATVEARVMVPIEFRLEQ